MKARVKKTGEIVEAELKGFDNLNVEHYIINGNQNWILSEFSLEFLESGSKLNYWVRLEFQAAIAAMGGMCGNTSYDETAWEDMAEDAIRAAHALVEKLKEKEERK